MTGAWFTKIAPPAAGPRRIHFFEVWVLLQIVALHALFWANDLGLRLVAFSSTLLLALKILVPLFLAGCLLRLGYSALVGKGASYWKRIRSWPWILLSLRLLANAALVIYFYSSLKGLLQVLHPVLHDELLWEIDRATLLGFSPNVLSLYAFRNPVALRLLDAAYGSVYFITLVGSIPFFFSLGPDRLRLSYATGCSVLWTAGAWLYFLAPSLGPCYAYAEVWEPFAAALPISIEMQRYLMVNYQMIRQIPLDSLPPEMNVLGGVAAFPSMHVGSQVFIALWIARLVRGARLVFYFSAALIFVGSVVTGWHYLVDSIVGLVLAWASFRLGFVLYGLERWEASLRPPSRGSWKCCRT